MLKNKISLLLLFFFIFSSSWFKFFLEDHEYFEAVYVILVSSLLFYLNKKKGKLKVILFFLPLLTIFFYRPGGNVIFNLDELEKYTINTRRLYYENITLGRFYENKIFYIFRNYQKNFFQGLDLNYYFFGNHPRERAGIKEIKKISFIFLPLFLVGLYSFIRKKSYLFLYYFFFSLITASFYTPIDIYSFLFFPFLVSCLTEGAETILLRDK